MRCTKWRTWDLVVSYFGDDPKLFRDPEENRTDAKGPKWHALKQLLLNAGNHFSEYEYVFVPDDDLELNGDDINKLFALSRHFNLALAQPSLTLDSFVSHAITLHNPTAIVRFTNYVENMAPCFHRAALEICVPTFDLNLSGWGLCEVWQHLLSEQHGEIGIVDAVQMRHTRPQFGPNYEHLKARRMSPGHELLDVLRKFGLKRPVLRNVRVVDTRGHEHRIGDMATCPEEWMTVPWGSLV